MLVSILNKLVVMIQAANSVMNNNTESDIIINNEYVYLILSMNNILKNIKITIKAKLESGINLYNILPYNNRQ